MNDEDNLWKCDGCDAMFDKSEIVDSIHEPYYACHDCEADLKKYMEGKND